MSDISFTEADIKKVADAINFIYTSAQFGKCDSKKAREITRAFDALGQHVKWMEGRIMELKQVVEPSKEKKAK